VLVVPDVEDLARGVGRARGAEQAVNDVVDVEAVPLLGPFAEDQDRLVEQRPTHEDRQETLKVVSKPLPGSVHVREADDRRGEPVALPVEEMQLLGGVLRDAVHVDGCHRVVLVDREVTGAAEQLTGRREH